jgi:Integrase core domain
LPDEQARTAIGFTRRARAFFTRHGIGHVHRIVTDNGACYRAHDFATVLHGARHQRITPYTPRHNGTVERYHRILAEEFLYAHTWTSEQHRLEALKIWNVHRNCHRPHTTAGNQPPATQLHTSVTNVMTSYRGSREGKFLPATRLTVITHRMNGRNRYGRLASAVIADANPCVLVVDKRNGQQHRQEPGDLGSTVFMEPRR